MKKEIRRNREVVNTCGGGGSGDGDDDDDGDSNNSSEEEEEEEKKEKEKTFSGLMGGRKPFHLPPLPPSLLSPPLLATSTCS